MLPNKVNNKRLALEWLLLAYLGILSRLVISLLTLGFSSLNSGFGLTMIWITIIISSLLNQWENVWVYVPRFVQWGLAFLVGFYSLGYWQNLPDFLDYFL